MQTIPNFEVGFFKKYTTKKNSFEIPWPRAIKCPQNWNFMKLFVENRKKCHTLMYIFREIFNEVKAEQNWYKPTIQHVHRKWIIQELLRKETLYRNQPVHWVKHSRKHRRGLVMSLFIAITGSVFCSCFFTKTIKILFITVNRAVQGILLEPQIRSWKQFFR